MHEFVGFASMHTVIADKFKKGVGDCMVGSVSSAVIMTCTSRR